RLAREDGVAGEALLLRALDLRVPVRALYEPNGNHAMPTVRKLLEPTDHRPRALLIGLHGDAEHARAGRKRPALEHLLEDGERKLEPVRFLGVDRDGGARLRGRDNELLELVRDLGHRAPRLRVLEAGVEGGELDRDARRRGDVRVRARAAA